MPPIAGITSTNSSRTVRGSTRVEARKVSEVALKIVMRDVDNKDTVTVSADFA